MVLHEARNNHGAPSGTQDSEVEFPQMEMLALTPLYSDESVSDVNGNYATTSDGSFPAPFFAFGDNDEDDEVIGDDDDDGFVEDDDDFDDDDDEDDYDDDEDDDDDDEFTEDEDDDFDEDDDDDYDDDDDE
jgi:hypothetical protein